MEGTNSPEEAITQDSESMLGLTDGLLITVILGMTIYYFFIKKNNQQDTFNARDTFTLS